MKFSSGNVESDDVRAFLERANVTALPKPYSLTQLRSLLAAL